MAAPVALAFYLASFAKFGINFIYNSSRKNHKVNTTRTNIVGTLTLADVCKNNCIFLIKYMSLHVFLSLF